MSTKKMSKERIVYLMRHNDQIRLMHVPENQTKHFEIGVWNLIAKYGYLDISNTRRVKIKDYKTSRSWRNKIIEHYGDYLRKSEINMLEEML